MKAEQAKREGEEGGKSERKKRNPVCMCDKIAY